MEREGIAIAGNMIVDITYPVRSWPKEGELASIDGEITRSVGGAVPNDIVDLAKMDPSIPLYAIGIVGDDSEGAFVRETLGRFPSIDLSGVKINGRTSFTSVMSNNETKARTFFHYRGANAVFSEDDIDWDSLKARILHVGYALLLDALDAPDDEYGTKMAKLLHRAQSLGIRTSIDVVTEAGNRFRSIVPPSLRYTDYCVINEMEAGEVTGVTLRDGDGTLHPERAEDALRKLRALGVSRWAVIHCPEGAFGLDEGDRYHELPSFELPSGFIKGTVGAGDAFCSGILYGAYRGMDLIDAMRIATEAACQSLTEPGATEGMRRVEELELLNERFPKRKLG